MSLSCQIKWLHSKPNWNCGDGEWTRGIFDMFQTLAGIFRETETGPSFSQLVRDHLALLSMEFERYLSKL
jgi:hypothetical protein